MNDCLGKHASVSAMILLTCVEYLTNHTKQSSIDFFPLEVDFISSKYTYHQSTRFFRNDGFELSEASFDVYDHKPEKLLTEANILRKHE